VRNSKMLIDGRWKKFS